MRKIIFTCFLVLFMLVSTFEVLGHSVFLSVEYDEYSKITDNNETDEKWYELVGLYGSTLGNKHLSQDVII